MEPLLEERALAAAMGAEEEPENLLEPDVARAEGSTTGVSDSMPTALPPPEAQQAAVPEQPPARPAVPKAKALRAGVRQEWWQRRASPYQGRGPCLSTLRRTPSRRCVRIQLMGTVS